MVEVVVEVVVVVNGTKVVVVEGGGSTDGRTILVEPLEPEVVESTAPAETTGMLALTVEMGSGVEVFLEL